MSDSISPFYPPRAKWHQRWWYVLAPLRRALRLDQVRLPDEVSWFKCLAGLVVPGYALFLFQRPAWGWIALTAWSLAALVFLAALGYPAGSIAFGLMIGAHVNSALFLLKRTMMSDEDTFRIFSHVLTFALSASAFYWFVIGAAWRENNLLSELLTAMFAVLLLGMGIYWLAVKFAANTTGVVARAIFSAATLVLYCACIYWPLLRFIESRLFLPLRVDNRVVVVNRLAKLPPVRRGEWVAFNIDRTIGNGVVLASGYGFEKVLALPGETVRFTGLEYEVNGQTHRRLPAMPASGAWVVPQKHWFVWPRLDISGDRSTAEPGVVSVLQRTAMVSEQQFIGRPFRHWFGRRQVFP